MTIKFKACTCRVFWGYTIIRSHIQESCSHILGQGFVAHISEVDKKNGYGGPTRYITSKEYLELLHNKTSRQLESAA